MSKEEGAPPTKRPPRPVMPQTVSISIIVEGEDDASHQRNVDELKSLSKQVCLYRQFVLLLSRI